MWFPWKRRSFGQRGEDLAARLLKREGYRVLERNVRLGRYEIDIIAREADTVAFVEVKTRRKRGPVDPRENVDRKKRDHIRRGADIWIQRNDDGQTNYRFDVVTVIWPEGESPETRLYRGAFDSRPG